MTTEIPKAPKKRTRDEWLAELQDASVGIWVAIRDAANVRLEDHDRDEGTDNLGEFIRDEYGSCQALRAKIENEGTGYFYHSYTTVPCDYDLYEEFVHDRDECWCGNNCYDESDEDEEEEDEEDEEEEPEPSKIC